MSKALTFGENYTGHAACVSCLCAASVRDILRSNTILKRYASFATRKAGQPSCAVFVIIVRLDIIKFGAGRYSDLATVRNPDQQRSDLYSVQTGCGIQSVHLAPCAMIREATVVSFVSGGKELPDIAVFCISEC